MQQPGPSGRRDWVIIASLIAVVAVSWVGFLVFWMRHKSVPAAPATQHAASRPVATQASQPIVAATTRPRPMRPEVTAAPASQSQPAGVHPVNPQEVALLQALQRARQLQDQGKSREAIAELQRAVQTQPAGASTESAPDSEIDLGSLLSHLSQSQKGGKSDDTSALLNAAVQMLAKTDSDVSGLLEDLEGDMNGHRKPSRGPNQANQAAAPVQADIVATVYGQPITRQEIGGAADGPSDVSLAKLNQRILEPLLDIYGKNQGIKANPGEIAVYQRVTRSGPANPPRQAINRPGQRGAPVQQVVDPAAEAAIIRWKVSKALYEVYGGVVVPGRSDRPEPVGAYGKFLREQEEKAAFSIQDEKYRERLWAYYDQDFSSRAVPPEKVNFNQPWWLKPGAAAEPGSR